MEYKRPYLSQKDRDIIYKLHGIEDRTDYELHHVIPVAYAWVVLGMKEWEINDYANLLPLHKDEHHGLHGNVAPDWKETGVPYWNTQNDEEYKQRALAAVRSIIHEEELKQKEV